MSDMAQGQQLCVDILHQVYSAQKPLAETEISQSIGRPLRSITLLIDQLVQSAYLQARIDDGVIYYQCPRHESSAQPHLPLPYHALNWDIL